MTTQNYSHNKLSELIERCDFLIKQGQSNEVAALISSLNLAQMPRSARGPLGKICRRAGLITSGLRVLQPIVRPEKKAIDPATPAEICEYAVLLSRNGSLSEAVQLLRSVDGEKHPESMLYLGYCHISNWDYERAIPLIENFLRTPADFYTQLIARVNLAASYLADDRLNECEDLLGEIIPAAKSSGASRLVGNALDILGHLYFQKNEFSCARQTLAEALEIFADHQSYDRLLVNKTLAIMAGMEQKSRAPLEKFRAEALEKNHFESVREIDIYRAKIHYDQKLVDHLLYGTPMPSFRQRLLRELGGGQMSESYVFGSDQKMILDLETGAVFGAGILNSGKKIHQTLAALVKDFYVPRNIGSLFGELYPDEYFDINSSRNRIQQLLSRTRAWLEENDVPAAIETQHGQLRFIIRGEFGIKMTAKTQTINGFSMKWNELRDRFSSVPAFSAKQACESLGWPRTKFQRVADDAVKSGQLLKVGTGRQTIYRINISISDIANKKSAA